MFNKKLQLELDYHSELLEELKKCIEDHEESLVELSNLVEKIEVKILEMEKKTDDLLHGLIQLTIAKSGNKAERPTFKSANETEIKEAKSKINCTTKDIPAVLGGWIKP